MTKGHATEEMVHEDGKLGDLVSPVMPSPTGKVSLHEAALLLEQINERLGDEDIDDEAIGLLAEQYLQATGLAHDAIDRYAYLIEQRTTRQKNRADEAKNQRRIADGLRDMAARDESLVRRLKQRLLEFMDRQGVKKIETDRFKVNAQSNGGEAPLLIDEEYSIATIIEQYPQFLSFSIDPTKVRAALKAGQDLPFAQLGERGRSLRIKP